MTLSEILEKYSTSLGVKSICPWKIEVDGEFVQFCSYFPDFGSAHGILVAEIKGPDYATSKIHRLAAQNLNIPISFVNCDSITDIHEFASMLEEWGYFGKGEFNLES